MTPQPTPTPGPAPQNATQLLNALGAEVGNTNKSKADLYGLGVWGQQTINPGDLPFLTGIVSTGGKTTADAVMKAFLSAAPDQVATIQHALLMGGSYPSSYTPKWGVVGDADRAAFANAIILAGQSQQPVSQLLETSAAYGAQAGIAAAQSRQGKVATVTLPNEQTLEAAAMAAFQAELGRKAKPKEAAAFAAAYRAMSGGIQRQNNQQVYDATDPGGLTGAMATADPTQLVAAATAPVPAASEWAPGGMRRENVFEPINRPQDFSQQIGGLQNLGMQVGAAAAGSAQPGGLTQLTQDSPVDPSVAATNFARNTHPQAAAANDVANVFQTFLSMLNGVGA